MSKTNTYRISVTLRGEVVAYFKKKLQKVRREEIKDGSLTLTSASELARQLIAEALRVHEFKES